MLTAYDIARPLLFRLDPEKAHKLTLKALRTGLVPVCTGKDDPALAMTLWDRKFINPVGLAAGFDKNAEAVGPLLRLGFGFVEAGTVTPQPQAGNPMPRIFRDGGSASIINAMGFPNKGLETFKANITKFLGRRPRPRGVIGINIGMNKDQAEPVRDYRLLVRELGALADYLTVNISSPNTPGLRNLQQRENLLPLLNGILEERAGLGSGVQPPVLVKLAPDLDEAQQADIAATLLESGIDGLILTNTTLDRPDSLPADFALNRGGLSGPLLHKKSTGMIRNFYRLTQGKLPIVGVGGVSSADDAYEKIRAGASLVQLYAALVFHGPGLVARIKDGLAERLRRDGFKHLRDAIGADVRA